MAAVLQLNTFQTRNFVAGIIFQTCTLYCYQGDAGIACVVFSIVSVLQSGTVSGKVQGLFVNRQN